MAIQIQNFKIDDTNKRIFVCTKTISSKQNVLVRLRYKEADANGNRKYGQLAVTKYELINNSIRINDKINIEIFDLVEIRIADNPNELMASSNVMAFIEENMDNFYFIFNNPYFKWFYENMPKYEFDLSIVSNDLNGFCQKMLHFGSSDEDILDNIKCQSAIRTVACNIDAIKINADAIVSGSVLLSKNDLSDVACYHLSADNLGVDTHGQILEVKDDGTYVFLDVNGNPFDVCNPTEIPPLPPMEPPSDCSDQPQPKALQVQIRQGSANAPLTKAFAMGELILDVENMRMYIGNGEVGSKRIAMYDDISELIIEVDDIKNRLTVLEASDELINENLNSLDDRVTAIEESELRLTGIIIFDEVPTEYEGDTIFVKNIGFMDWDTTEIPSVYEKNLVLTVNDLISFVNGETINGNSIKLTGKAFTDVVEGNIICLSNNYPTGSMGSSDPYVPATNPTRASTTYYILRKGKINFQFDIRGGSGTATAVNYFIKVNGNDVATGRANNNTTTTVLVEVNAGDSIYLVVTPVNSALYIGITRIAAMASLQSLIDNGQFVLAQ